MQEFASCAPSTNIWLNCSRPHSMQCSIQFGKFLSVHIGIDSSGGSWESPQQSVLWGTIICELALVPRVPDSSKGFSYQTHFESTQRRAFTLSTALTTKSKLSQNLSLNTASVSGETIVVQAYTFKAGFIPLAISQAVWDLECPT